MDGLLWSGNQYFFPKWNAGSCRNGISETFTIFSTEEILEVFSLAQRLKKEVSTRQFSPLLRQKTLAMIFEKPSLRTRSTFEIAMNQMGGSANLFWPE